MHTHINIYKFVCVCVLVCACVRACECVCRLCINVIVHTNTHKYTHMYTHTYIPLAIDPASGNLNTLLTSPYCKIWMIESNSKRVSPFFESEFFIEKLIVGIPRMWGLFHSQW